MHLASTKSVASSFFSAAADEASEASSAAKPSKTDADDSPDFLAILALLFPGNLIAPTTPTVTDASTSATNAALVADGTIAATGLPTANAINVDANNTVASVGPQELPKPPIGPTPKESPFAAMTAQACEAAPPENVVETPNTVGAAGTAQAPVAQAPVAPEQAPVAPEAVAPSPAAQAVAHEVGPTASNVAPNRASDAVGRGSVTQPKALLNPQTIAKDDAPTVAQEKSMPHESGSPPPLDAMKTVPVLATMNVGFVNETQKSVSEARDDGTSSPSSISVPAHSEDAANPLAARTEAAAKPALSFVDQVHSVFQDNLDHLREHGRVELHMDLHPPDLGRMRLHLSMEDNQVHVRMDVQDERAKQALEQQMQPLRVHFAEMGVSLGQLDVRRDGTGNTPQQDQNPDAQARTPLASPARPEIARLRSAYERGLNSDSLVDVLA